MLKSAIPSFLWLLRDDPRIPTCELMLFHPMFHSQSEYLGLNVSTPLVYPLQYQLVIWLLVGSVKASEHQQKAARETGTCWCFHKCPHPDLFLWKQCHVLKLALPQHAEKKLSPGSVCQGNFASLTTSGNGRHLQAVERREYTFCENIDAQQTNISTRKLTISGHLLPRMDLHTISARNVGLELYNLRYTLLIKIVRFSEDFRKNRSWKKPCLCCFQTFREENLSYARRLAFAWPLQAHNWHKILLLENEAFWNSNELFSWIQLLLCWWMSSEVLRKTLFLPW